MSTESLKYAKFDHPRHGSFERPQAVLDDDRLTEAEKHALLQEWEQSLKQRLNEDSDAPEIRNTREDLDSAIEKLAAGRT